MIASLQTSDGISDAIMEKDKFSEGILKELRQIVKMDIKRVEVDHQLCLVCGACVGVCPANAMCLEKDRLEIWEELCTHCGRCIQVCPVRALSQGAGSK